jgi:hypothetical protein
MKFSFRSKAITAKLTDVARQNKNLHLDFSIEHSPTAQFFYFPEITPLNYPNQSLPASSGCLDKLVTMYYQHQSVWDRPIKLRRKTQLFPKCDSQGW